MRIWMLILLVAALAATGCTETTVPPLTAEASTPNPKEDAPPADAATAEPVRYANITIAVRRDAETVSERAVTGEEEMAMAEEIVLDCLVKSAAWEGVEASELEDCIILSFDAAPGEERQFFFQYTVEGRPVLQMGETGRYTIMGDDAYGKLMQLAGEGA